MATLIWLCFWSVSLLILVTCISVATCGLDVNTPTWALCCLTVGRNEWGTINTLSIRTGGGKHLLNMPPCWGYHNQSRDRRSAMTSAHLFMSTLRDSTCFWMAKMAGLSSNQNYQVVSLGNQEKWGPIGLYRHMYPKHCSMGMQDYSVFAALKHPLVGINKNIYFWNPVYFSALFTQ